MQTHKIIYISLISLLAVSLLIPTISATSCFDGDLEIIPETGRVFTNRFIELEVDKESVEIPMTDTPNIVKLTGALYGTPSIFSDPPPMSPFPIPISGEPVEIEVWGPGGRHWDKRHFGYTNDDGEFHFDFEIMKTAEPGIYDAVVYAYGKQARVSFKVVEPTVKIRVGNDLPYGVGTSVWVDGVEVSGQYHTGVPYWHESTRGQKYQIRVEPIVQDELFPNIYYVCLNNEVEVVGEGEVFFEYVKFDCFSIVFHPSDLSNHILLPEQQFELDIPSHDPSGCLFCNDPNKRFELNLPDEINFEGVRYENGRWVWGSESHDSLKINIPLNTVEKETEPAKLEIFYETKYEFVLESNLEWLEFTKYVEPGYVYDLPDRTIDKGPFGLFGGYRLQNPNSYSSSIVINEPTTIRMDYDYDYTKPAIVVGLLGTGFAFSYWYKKKKKPKLRIRRRGGEGCFGQDWCFGPPWAR